MSRDSKTWTGKGFLWQAANPHADTNSAIPTGFVTENAVQNGNGGVSDARVRRRRFRV